MIVYLLLACFECLFTCCFLVVYCLGKWTTYRSMAQDTVDRLVEVAGLQDEVGCRTNGFVLDGGEGWHPTSFIRLIQDHGIEVEVSGWVGVAPWGAWHCCFVLKYGGTSNKGHSERGQTSQQRTNQK